MSDATRRYLRRDASIPDNIRKRGTSNHDLWCVIPACREFEWFGATLESLSGQDTNLVVVVNEPPDADERLRADNRKLLDSLEAIAEPIWLVDCTGACAIVGGVGEARRLGFDLAMHEIGERSGCLLASLDADSPVDEGWARELRGAARRDESIRTWFEHPLENDHIATYELWHRYLAAGMRQAGSPYAYDVLGCAFAVTPDDYAVARGMPRRSATEDFHFVNKVVKNRGPRALEIAADAIVRPSARPSDRVPLGTGPAVAELAGGTERWHRVEDPAAFEDISAVYQAVEDIWNDGRPALRLSPVARSFFDSEGWFAQLERLRGSATQLETFERSLSTWFDAMRALRLFNHVAQAYGRIPLSEAVGRQMNVEGDSHAELLLAYRRQRRRELEVRGSVS